LGTGRDGNHAAHSVEKGGRDTEIIRTGDITAGRDVSIFTGDRRIGTFVQGTDPETAANVRELLAVARRSGIFNAAAQNAIPEAAVRAVVEKAGGIGVASEDLISWLKAWVHDARVEREMRLPRPDDKPTFRAIRQEAHPRFDSGRLDASQAFVEAFEGAKSTHPDSEQSRSCLPLLEEALQLDKLALNGRSAAEMLQRMAAIEHPENRDEQIRYLTDRADKFYERGETGGDNAAMLVAASAYRIALTEIPRDRMPVYRANTLTNLGNTLMRLGERSSGTACLAQAEVAYRAALAELAELPHDSLPLDWATTQMNFATALRTLGERENDRVRLEQAVGAYRAVLTELTPTLSPFDWAMAQMGLGNALRSLGLIEGGTAGLEQAVEAHRAALMALPADQSPIEWAMVQGNLGAALLHQPQSAPWPSFRHPP
jgi:tetratricopeptide (TPR) repeat protein